VFGFSARTRALYGCASACSARLPIRTLPSEYELAAMLQNTYLVSLGDLDGLQNIAVRMYFVSAT